MSDLKVSAIAAETGFSVRYWQRRIGLGEVPGASYIDHGGRRTYKVDADKFRPWWAKQKVPVCPATLKSAVKSGGIASPKTASRTKARFKPNTSEQLKAAFKDYAKI